MPASGRDESRPYIPDGGHLLPLLSDLQAFPRPCRGFTDFAIPPTVPPYGSTVGYYPTPLRG